MLRRLQILIAGSFFIILGLMPASALAIDCSKQSPTNTQEAIQCGTDKSAGVLDGGDPGSRLDNTIKNGVNLISLFVGVIAVIMIIVSGLKYITSGGEADKVKGAKNTIVYAIIGLVIVAFAQLIVRVVINEATTTSSNGSASASTSAGAECKRLYPGYQARAGACQECYDNYSDLADTKTCLASI